MRSPPTNNYSGLTVVLSEPSRHDKLGLLSGWAGSVFNNFLLPLNRTSVDIRDLSVVEPLLKGTKVILALGERYLKLLSKDYSLNKLRGSIIYINDIVVIPTFSPQDALDRQNYEDEDEVETEEGNTKEFTRTKRKNWRWWLSQDIRKAVLFIYGKTPAVRSYSPVFCPSIAQLTPVLSSTTKENLYLDIETDKNLNHTCIGLSTDSTTDVFVVPVKKFDGGLWYEEREMLAFIKLLCLATRNKTVVGHNLSFDLFVNYLRWRLPFPKTVFDTMLVWHRLYPELEKSLGHLISYFLFEPHHKGDSDFDPKTYEGSVKLWSYNAKDVGRMKQFYPLLATLVDKEKSTASVANVNRMLRPYLTMSAFGASLDTVKLEDSFKEFDDKRSVLCKVLNTVVGKELNPSSPKQVGEYLYGELGLEEPEEDKTAENTLLTHALKKPAPSLKLIISIRGIRKSIGSLKFRSWHGRYTTAYNIAGTETFRLGSRGLLKFRGDKGFGGNFQNWNKKIRKLIVADRGKILLQADQASAEALVVAFLCRKGNLRTLMEEKIKPHVFVALKLFVPQWSTVWGNKTVIEELANLSPACLKAHKHFKEVEKLIKSSDDWPPNERYYYMGKKTCHSANYDIKAKRFCTSILVDSGGAITLPITEGERFLRTYKHDIFPEILDYYEETKALVKRDRRLDNLVGDSRYFFGQFDESYAKQWYAFRPQSTVGQITNIAIANLQEQLDNGEHEWLDILQNGHDSILVQVDEDKVSEGATLLSSILSRDLVSPTGVEFRMGVEVSVGHNWAPKSSENPEGLTSL